MSASPPALHTLPLYFLALTDSHSNRAIFTSVIVLYNYLTLQYTNSMLSLVVNSRLHHRQPTHFRRCPAFLPSSLHLIATSLLPCFLASSSSNSFPCHTSKKPVSNPFLCHTSKNTEFKAVCLPHIRKTGGSPRQMFRPLVLPAPSGAEVQDALK